MPKDAAIDHSTAPAGAQALYLGLAAMEAVALITWEGVVMNKWCAGLAVGVSNELGLDEEGQREIERVDGGWV